MKKIHLILATSLLITVVAIITIVYRPNSHIKESQIPHFSINQLTTEELLACNEFKLRKGQTRHPQAEKIKKLSILPIVPLVDGKDDFHLEFDYDNPPFIMTRKDVTNLLGDPSHSDKNNFRYDLGFIGGTYHGLTISFRHGHVVGHGGLEIH